MQLTRDLFAIAKFLFTIPEASLVAVFSAVFVISCGQTDRHTDADERLTPATRRELIFNTCSNIDGEPEI